jgi:hypothetical protein
MSNNNQVLTKPIIVIIMSALVVFIQVVDKSAGDTWAGSSNMAEALKYTALFSLIASTSIVLQALFLRISKALFSTHKTASGFATVIMVIYVASQITVIAFIAFIMAEQLITTSYHRMLSEIIITFSLIIPMIILFSLATAFVKSYLSSRQRIIALYAVAMGALSIQLMFAFIYAEIVLHGTPGLITPGRNPWVSYFYTDIQGKISSVYEAFKIVTFTTVWLATIIFTKKYSHRWKVKYWIVVTIPVLYFIIQYPLTLLMQSGILSPLVMSEGSLFPYVYNIIINTVDIGTGILFGISFFVVSKSVEYVNLKFYLTICGAGVMIIFSGGISTTLILAPYPSWGIVSISFVLPAAFLVTMGFNSTVYNIASNRSIRRYFQANKNEFKIFYSLGTAEVSSIIEKKVNDITNKISDNLDIETLFQPAPGSDDIKQYVRQVVQEMKETHRKSDKDKS